MLDTLLHHVGRKFVLGQVEHLAGHCLHDLGLVILQKHEKLQCRCDYLLSEKRANSCLLSMFQNVLYDVVSVLVLEQLFSVGVELLQDGASLFRCAVLKDPLDHSAPVRMG